MNFQLVSDTLPSIFPKQVRMLNFTLFRNWLLLFLSSGKCVVPLSHLPVYLNKNADQFMHHVYLPEGKYKIKSIILCSVTAKQWMTFRSVYFYKVCGEGIFFPPSSQQSEPSPYEIQQPSMPMILKAAKHVFWARWLLADPWVLKKPWCLLENTERHSVWK